MKFQQLHISTTATSFSPTEQSLKDPKFLNAGIKSYPPNFNAKNDKTQ
jgi:hypothetical protein